MKRFLVLFLTVFVFNSYSSQAATQYTESQITTIGQKILTDNKLPKEVKFNVVESDTVNAYADTNNDIVIYTGLLNLVEKDEELAGIMSYFVRHNSRQFFVFFN